MDQRLPRAAIIDGKAIAARITAEVAAEARELAGQGWTPRLVSVSVGDTAAAELYVRNQQKQAENAGVGFEARSYPAETSLEQLIGILQGLNHDPRVNGIIIQRPVPKHLDIRELQTAIHPLKDVDAFHPENVGLMLQGRPRFLPCTPHGVMLMLKHEGIDTAGQNAVVIGRSNIVGKPMALLLLMKNATVTVCHSRTQDLAGMARSADIVVAAIGRPRFVTADMVKEGAVVIDVGINRVDGKLVGDVDFDAVAPKASHITPVPGGVGPMTIAMLMDNTLRAFKAANGL